MGSRVLTLIAALGATASLAQPGAPPQASYLIVHAEVEELRKVVGDKVAEHWPLGVSTVFGVADGKLATISQRNEGGRGVQHLTVLDLATGAVVAEHNVEPRLLTWLSGPEPVVLVRPQENAVYFVTLEVAGDSVWNALDRLDLETGKLSSVKIPPEVANPRPFELQDGVGVCSWNHGAIADLKNGAFKLLAEPGKAARTVVDRDVVSACLSMPGVGIVRVVLSGKLEVFDPAKLDPGPVRTFALGASVASPQAATLDGKPVLVYGEAVNGAMGQRAVTALVIYDPVAGKQLWRKPLPALARSFTVSKDASVFRLVPVASVQLQTYDRRTDAFAKWISLKPRELDTAVLVPTE
jgi:hypothetical protein